MPIDIRAEVSCSLGTVISGSFADDYLQGNGLIKTRGEVVLAGTQTPTVGTQVTFTYVKQSTTYTLPRVLRVLSSFADPFRRTTTVQLGCKLTYLENRKPPVENPNSKDENAVPCYVYAKATLPISASYVFQHCLTALGLSSDAIPLTNKFSLEEFDLTPGYLQVMSDLLQSESYVGYLDSTETLRFRDLSVDTGTGPVITPDDVADLGPIGSGDLPGESVVVRWSNLRLLPPDELYGDEYLKRSWESDEVFGAPSEVSVSYTNDAGGTSTDYDIFFPYSFSATRYDVWDRKIESISYTLSSSAEVNNRWASDAFKSGGSGWNIPTAKLVREVIKYKKESSALNNVNLLSLQQLGGNVTTLKNQLGAAAVDNHTGLASLCKEDAPDGSEVVESQTTYTYFSELELAGSLSLDTFINDAGSLVQFDTVAGYLESVVTVEYDTDESSGISKTITKRSISRSQTVSGQQDLATRAQSVDTANLSASINGLLAIASLLVYIGAETQLHTQREYGLQKRPSETDRNNTANTKPQVTESVADLTWVVGSTTSTAVTEFTLPYAPDDAISWSEVGGYTSTESDAKQKALRYGRIQNALLLGNRNGVSLQLAPELLPKRPFDPLYLQAGGITASYRVNGTSWAFDANGIVASTDALLWGAVSAASGTDLASSWVPLAPGTTSLPLPYTPTGGSVDPETGAALAAVITPAMVLPPYLENVAVEGISRTSIALQDYPYTLDRGTETQTAVTRTRLLVGSKLAADLGLFLLSGQPAALAYKRAVRGAAGSFTSTGYSAGSIRDYAIGTNAGAFALGGQQALVKYQRTALAAAPASLILTGQDANFFKGGTLAAAATGFAFSGANASLLTSRVTNGEASAFAITGQAASLGFVLPSDPYFSSVQLLLKGEGTNGGTIITDSSLKNRTPATTSSTVTSTSQYKFGTASLYFDAVSTLSQRGFNYSIATADKLGTGDYTIEMFFRINAAGRLYQLFAIDTFDGFLRVDAQGSIRWLNQIFTPATPIAANTWYHVAAVRSSSSVSVFLDGTQIGSTITSTRDYTSSTWWVGRDFDSDNGLYGYIDELRLTKGIARYTSNFTPPTATLPVGLPSLVGSLINSDSTADTTAVVTMPTHEQGDLLVAVLMWRDDLGTLTVPSGWTLQGTYLDQIAFSGSTQNILVYTKYASSSEPASYTWSATVATRNAWMSLAVRNAQIESVTEDYGNGTTASIDTVDNRLNVTVFTWVYAASGQSETYSQTSSNNSLNEITDSPKANARLSGGHTYSASTVTSIHSANSDTEPPNHGGINIRFKKA